MSVPEIDVADLAEALSAGAPLLDVRQPAEYEEFHVPGAVLVPLGELPERLDQIPSGAPLYVICRSGGRSAKAVEFLRARGTDAVNVAGGALAWQSQGHPVATGSAGH